MKLRMSAICGAVSCLAAAAVLTYSADASAATTPGAFSPPAAAAGGTLLAQERVTFAKTFYNLHLAQATPAGPALQYATLKLNEDGSATLGNTLTFVTVTPPKAPLPDKVVVPVNKAKSCTWQQPDDDTVLVECVYVPPGDRAAASAVTLTLQIVKMGDGYYGKFDMPMTDGVQTPIIGGIRAFPLPWPS